MISRRCPVVVATVAVVAAATSLPVRSVASNPSALRGPSILGTAVSPPGAPPDALTQPLADGCQRYPLGLFSRTSPEWAYVGNKDTAATGPPPAPQWVSGTVSAFNPNYQAVHTSGGDLPFGHRAFDYNVNILVDPAYQNLLGGAPPSGTQKATGNYAGGGEESHRLHTEWEDLSVPKFAWAEPGDQIVEKGAWVWDCGHWGTPTEVANPDYILPKVGQPAAGCLVPSVSPIIDTTQCVFTGESTEFHPYRALWDVRARSSTSPEAEAQAELFVSTDKTLAGVEADCAHRNPPLSAAGYPPAYRACLDTDSLSNWQDVSGDYSFYLPAPPAPSSTAHIVYRSVDQGSSGAPAPTLAAEGNGVRVTFHLATAPNQALRMAYTVYAGWDEVPLAIVPTHLHITLDKIEVHHAMDPGCTTNAFGLPTPNCPFKAESTRNNQLSTAPANWNLYYDATGVWGQWTNGGTGELHVSNGDVLGGTQSLDLYVPPGQGWRFFVHGRECDLGALGMLLDCPSDKDLADDNDVQGRILDQYASVQASLGTHRSSGQTHKDDPTSTCPDINLEGCYSLTYTVTLVDDAASRVRNGPGSVVPELPVLAAPLIVLLAAIAIALVRRRRLPAR